MAYRKTGTLAGPYKNQKTGTLAGPYKNRNPSGTLQKPEPYKNWEIGTLAGPYKDQKTRTLVELYRNQNTGTLQKPENQDLRP